MPALFDGASVQREIVSSTSLPRTTAIHWCVRRPLAEMICDVVIASDRIHADDTPIPKLDPKTDASRCWRAA